MCQHACVCVGIQEWPILTPTLDDLYVVLGPTVDATALPPGEFRETVFLKSETNVE